MNFESVGPIITFIPSFLNSSHASNIFSFFEPRVFWIYFYLNHRLCRVKLRFTEYSIVSPKSLSSPEKGAKLQFLEYSHPCFQLLKQKC